MTPAPASRPLSHPALRLPPPDPSLSPRTGLTRAHWEAVADQLLLALRPHSSVDGAQILPPGRLSRSGRDSDGLEGFARSFLIAAMLQHGRGGADPEGHAEQYARGLAAGVDPRGANPWPRPAELPQSKVEACSVALALDLTREWIWDRLDQLTRDRLVEWFSEVIGTRYPPVNWVWFRIIVLTFLRSVDDRFASGEPAAALRADLAQDLRIHESLVRDHGWFDDGPVRGVDHYNTWAFAALPILWLRMRGIRDLEADGLVTAADPLRHQERVAAFTHDALGLVGGDGAPLLQGRSLVYRMATAAPFWSAALAGLADGPDPLLAPGALRRAASGELAHFLRHGVPDDRGLLTLGWFHEFPEMAQSYSGPGSPYWACKGFLGLILPADHPVWTAPEQPLPVEQEDAVQALTTPGWIVSRTREDGIVRVINHGNDHGQAGEQMVDGPLYARLGYSTVTSPALAGPGTVDPRDATVSLVDPERGWSHRAGFDRVDLRAELLGSGERIGIGISRQLCHWVDAEPGGYGGYGQGGETTPGALLTVASIVRGAGELRVIRAEQDTVLPVAVAGWPLSGPGPVAPLGAATDASGAAADGPAGARIAREDQEALVSTLEPVLGSWTASLHREQDVSPLGSEFAVPQLHGAALAAGEVVAVHVVLRGEGAAEPPAPRVDRAEDGTIHVTWADGARLTVDPGDPGRFPEIRP
ncbi:DUF2264 domain-containing protein [Brachybacterium sp. YJGR34]|uniref:DUF2264 domain-containing protein n=1 Tax=Brachybacterium sp. YJGR34 TaxID=2059911 RepID=UPI001E43DF4F|nr:DUF2264 domain-containing protein [Brachybacterium sp. YJGR34]